MVGMIVSYVAKSPIDLTLWLVFLKATKQRRKFDHYSGRRKINRIIWAIAKYD